MTLKRVAKWHTALGLMGGVALLGAVFMFYYQPDVLIALTNQVWACF